MIRYQATIDNFEVSVFGENTDNFLYMVRDYELEIQEKKLLKSYLSMFWCLFFSK